MVEDADESTKFEHRPADRIPTIEGYLALVFVGLTFVGSAIRIPAPYGAIFGFAVWGLAWLFAISGARRGRAGARIAGWISLGILLCHAALLLIFAVH